MRRLLKDWQDALVFVKPETVIRWHREGWRYVLEAEVETQDARRA